MIEKVSISPSALESAFVNELNTRFNSTVSNGTINEYREYHRFAHFPQDNGLLLFQYRRFDPLQSHVDHVLMVFQDEHPNKEYESFPRVPDFEDPQIKDTPWEYVSADINFISYGAGLDVRALEMLRQKIESDGGYDTISPLTNPNFFTQHKLTQWPEMFEFSVFRDSQGINIPKPHEWLPNGRILDRRPDVLVHFTTDPIFEGIDNYKLGLKQRSDNKIIVTYPKNYVSTSRSYLLAFDEERITPDGKAYGHEIDQTEWFPGNKPISFRLPEDSPDELMNKFAGFAKELVKQ